MDDRRDDAGDRAPLTPGATLGHLYRVRRHIGRGGQGDVYEVEHTRLGSRFAAKVLRRRAAVNTHSVQRFEREAIAASRLEHPHIARVVNFDHTEEGEPFAVMELLDGENLAHVIARGPIPMLEACRLAIDVASALEAAHAAGVIHRDLKPSNLVLARGVVKLTDFGISKVFDLDDGLKLTRPGAIVGTPLYMAPEQARGKQVDGRTDVYALGLVLLEMVAGKPAFDPSGGVKLLVRKAREPSPEPLALAPFLPPSLAGVIRRAIAKDPDARHATMRELRVALEDVAADLSTLETPADVNAPTELHVEPSPRVRAPWIAGAVLVAAAGAAAYLIASAASSERPTDAGLAAVAPDASGPLVRPRRPVTLDSIPSGARVLGADGTVRGTTPLVLVLARPETFRLEREGMAAVEVPIHPDDQAGQTLRVELPQIESPATKPHRPTKKPKRPEPLPVHIP